MTQPSLHICRSKEAFVSALTYHLAATIAADVATTGQCLLGVSGGSTPLPIYDALSNLSLPWSSVTAVLADERFVPPGHDASNETAIGDSLQRGHAEDLHLIGLYSKQESAELAADIADEKITSLARHFDTILLGMGADGHTASIFPGASELDAALSLSTSRKVMALVPAEMPAHAPHPRLTLTMAEISKAKRLVLALTGSDKRKILDQALAGASAQEFPVAALFADEMPPVDIFWSE